MRACRGIESQMPIQERGLAPFFWRDIVDDSCRNVRWCSLFNDLNALRKTSVMAENQTQQSSTDGDDLSPSARRLLDEGARALSRAQPDAAARALVGALAMAPNNADIHLLLGVACQMQGEHLPATDSLQRSLALRPDHAMTHMHLGISLHELGQTEACLFNLKRACDLAPGMASAWFNLGKALKVIGQRDEACDMFKRAIELDPSHILSRTSLADTQLSLGEISAAVANYREVLRRHPDHSDAWYALANIKTELLSDADVTLLQRAFRKPGTPVAARIPLGFALAKALDDQGAYEKSFEILREANHLKRQQIRWNAEAERQHVEAIMAAFSQPTAIAADPTLGREVIFIVSLPRSGSTLVEQILASHRQVQGADEITDLPEIIEAESRRRGEAFPKWAVSATSEDWERLGREYLARTERWRKQRPWFTDKNMLSWQHLGAALAMLPGARAINCHRDPLETCFACYRQLFSLGSHFSYDLEEMASYYIDFARMSRFWQQSFPQQVLDYPYESLIANPELQIRRLLDFCDLEFDPACLSFHETSRTVLSTASAAQVRQPLQKYTARTSHYESQLAPLRARLAAASVR